MSEISLLIADDAAIIREPIAALLREAGFDARCAADGVEAVETMRRSPPDILLLDLAMPKANGFDVLKAMRADPRLAAIPVILLTAVSDKRLFVEAAKFGVRDCVLKTGFSTTDLVARIRRLVASAREAAPTKVDHATAGVASGARVTEAPAAQPADAAPARPKPLLTREESLERAERAFDMKTMPGVVMEVIAQAASPRTDSANLAALIGRDSMLATKVLQAANSAAYSSSRGMVSTLPEAVRNIGCGTVRNIAASMGIFDVMPNQADEACNPVRCWQHSLAVAVLCERLAGLSDLVPPNVAYLVGLCHDLGEILFRTAFAAEYRQVIEAQQHSGLRRDAVERVMLGVTHREMVGLILGKLGLPESIRAPILASGSMSGRSDDPAAQILALANVYANGLTLCESSLARVAPVTRVDCRSATGQDEPPLPDGSIFAGEIVALTSLLARLSAAQERELTRPLLARSGARVWLVRDRAFSAYDPIAAVLASVASDVRAEQRSPGAGELEETDRVVVVRPSTSVSFSEVQGLLAHVPPEQVLWLVGKIDLPVPAAVQVRPREYPVSLEEIEDFVTTPAVAAAA